MAFRDRVDAGKALGSKLSAYRGRPDMVVLGLARGGVPVAEQVALSLGAPLDVFVVRKLGVPGHQLRAARLERAIGVIYLPETERASHYFYARLSDQFDAVIHLGSTRAIEPLERTAEWQRGEVPETFPSAV